MLILESEVKIMSKTQIKISITDIEDLEKTVEQVKKIRNKHFYGENIDVTIRLSLSLYIWI